MPDRGIELADFQTAYQPVNQDAERLHQITGEIKGVKLVYVAKPQLGAVAALLSSLYAAGKAPAEISFP